MIAAANSICVGFTAPWGFRPLANAIIALASLSISGFGYLWLVMACKGTPNLLCDLQSSWAYPPFLWILSAGLWLLISAAGTLFLFGLLAPMICPAAKPDSKK